MFCLCPTAGKTTDRHPYCLATAVVISVLGWVLPAGAANVFEKAIKDANPCRSLKVDLGITMVGVDQFGGVEIEALNINVEGDRATMGASGSLACRTSDSAVFPGDLGVTFNVNADMDLLSCQMDDLDIEIIEFRGSFRSAVEPLKDQISDAVRVMAMREVAKLCE